MANITRIRTNQISDGNVTASKIASQTLTGSLFAPDLSLNSNVTILGNLSISGNTSTINSVNTYIQDPIVVFNNGYTGSMSGRQSGILVNRNYAALSQYGAVNTAWVWVEADQAFESITTATSGNALTTLSSSGFANLKVGNITAPSLTSSGTVSAGLLTGPLSSTAAGITTLVATNFSSGNAVISGGYITGLANLQTTNMTSTTSVATNFSTGNAQITSALVTTGVVTNLSSGNVVLTGGYATGLANVYSTLATVTNFSTANAQITNGSATTLVATNLSTGNLVLTGSASIGTLVVTNFSTGNAQIAGGYADNFPIGANTAASGKFTTLTNSGVHISNGNIVAASGTASSSTTTGALVVVGGAGVSGALYVGGGLNNSGNSAVNGGGLTTTQTTGYLFNEVATTLNVGSAATTLNLGATSGIATLANPTLVGTQTTQNVYNTVATTVNAFGAATTLGLGASTGTASINNATLTLPNATTVNVNGASPTLATTSTGTVTLFNTNATTVNAFGAATTIGIGNASGTTTVQGIVKATGNVVAAATTPSTSATTGALVVAGGVGIGGDAYIAGNLSVNGTLTYIHTTTELVSGVEIVAGNLVANSGTASTTTSTGALVVIGGAGISGAVNVGGTLTAGSIQNTPIGSSTASTGAFTTLTSSSTITSNGNLVAASGTASSSVTTGALVVVGGAGVSGQLYVGGLNATTSSVGTEVATNFSAANAQITNESVVTSVVTNLSTANARITGGYVTLTNVTATWGNIDFINSNVTNANRGNLTNIGTSNLVATVASVGTLLVTLGFSAGNAIISNADIYTLVADNFSSGNAFISSGYADNFKLGANTAQTAKVTTLLASGITTLQANTVISATTATNDPNTGALVVKGGAAVNGNVNIGNQLFVGATAQSSVLTAAMSVFKGTSGSGAGTQYTQVSTINTTSTGSADYIVYGDNYPGPSNDHGFADLGFTGSGFNDPAFSITKSNDAYVFASAVAGSGLGGNLVLATDNSGTYNDVVVAAGSFFSNAEVARFHGNVSTSGYLNLAYTTNSAPASNTGALRVQGGASFASNVYAGGSVVLNGSATAGNDFKVKGAVDSTLVMARPNSTYDSVIIGAGSNPQVTNGVGPNGAKLVINTTDSILLPIGSDATRPGQVGYTDVTGMFRYSTTKQSVEWFNGTSWAGATSSFTVITSQQFNGDGSTTVFTLSAAATTAGSIISINGVVQTPGGGYAYSISGTTLTFTEAPAVGDLIDVRCLTTTQQVNSLSGTYTSIDVSNDNIGVLIKGGTTSTANIAIITPTGAFVTTLANTAVSTANTPTVVDNMNTNYYRSAKYVVQASINGAYQVMEALVITDGTTATITTYGVIQTGGNLGVLSAVQNSGNVQLTFTSSNASTNVRVKKDYLLI
jgi:hypothetical protein